MYIKLNDKEYLISQDVKEQIISMMALEAIKVFDKLGTTHQILAEQAARGILYSMEKKMLSAGYEKDKAAALRPERGQSPVKKLVSVVASLARDFDIDGGVSLSVDEDNTIYSVTLEKNE